MEQTSRRRLGMASGNEGSSGMAMDGVADPARDGWLEALREVPEVERAATRLGMMAEEE